MSLEAMKQALEALDAITDDVDGTGLNTNMSFDKSLEAITSLRQAIEQAEKQEPVGEVLNERGEVDYISYVPPAGTFLYTTPQPQREWVGLTDEEVMNCYLFWVVDLQDIIGFYKGIETKLKEKNT